MKSPSGAWGGNPIVTPRSPNREAIQKGENQGAKRNLIPTKPLKTAAKRRWGLGIKSPSGVWGGNPIVTPRSPNREAIQKGENQGAKRNLIPTKPLKTAAKRRWGLGIKSPSGVWGGNPIVTPRSPNREAIQKGKNQGAKRNLIPTKPLKTAAKRRWESEG